MHRRQFLRAAALAGATGTFAGCGKRATWVVPEPGPSGPAPAGARAPEAAAPPLEAAPPPPGATTVVTVRSQQAVRDGLPNAPAVVAMLDSAMAELTGKRDARQAFGQLFRPDDVVAVKVNCIARASLSTSPVVCAAVVSALKSAGVKPGNIIVYDRDRGELDGAGFDIVTSGGPLCMSTDGKFGAPVSSGQYSGRLTALLDRATALINLPVLKHHTTTAVTMALKNHYGSIDNPSRYHRNLGVPGVAEVNSVPKIKQIQRLVVLDATRACFDGGPTPPEDQVVIESALMVATDPVALDTVGFDLINRRRQERGQGPLPRPGWLDRAQQLGVGTADRSKIRAEEVRV